MTDQAKREFLEDEGLEFRVWNFQDDPHIMHSWFAGPGVENPMSTDFAYAKFQQIKKEKEKREFLEREGWKINTVAAEDPDNKGVVIDIYFAEDLAAVYKLASNRKAARERARLKKVGFRYVPYDDYYEFPAHYEDPKGKVFTRQEAIAYLDRMEGE